MTMPPHTTDQSTIHQRATDQPDAPIRAKAKRWFVGTWKATIKVLRNIAALAFAILFAIAGTHGRFIHDDPLTMVDVTECFLAACCIFGEKGLKLYASRKEDSR